jgi:Flp pilus assembly protein TadD
VLEPEVKLAEALSQIRRAIELDPLAASPRNRLAFALLRAGDADQALTVSRAVIAANPDNAYARQLCARALLMTGKRVEALALLQQLGPPSHAYLGYAHALMGRRQDAEALAAEDDPAAVRHQVLIYAGLGDRERSFDPLSWRAGADFLARRPTHAAISP